VRTLCLKSHKPESRTEWGKDQFPSLRSRREHIAWGVSPGKWWLWNGSPRQRAKAARKRRLSPVVTGLRSWCTRPGAYAPGCTLAPAAQGKKRFKVIRDFYRDAVYDFWDKALRSVCSGALLSL